jgi:DNA-binding NarL/FixJ family response regulator
MLVAGDKIRLYWIEEQEIFQKLYDAIFTAESPVTVVNRSDFGDFQTLKSNLSRSSPDILMVGCKNIHPDLLNELEAAHKSNPGMGIVILASVLNYEDIVSIRQYVENNKSPFGFFFKKSLSQTDQIFSIFTLIMMGQVVIDPALASLLSVDKDKSALFGGLTPREMEILNLVARGYTNVAIGNRLYIDVKTVRHHINNIYSKIKIADEFDEKHPRVSATNIYLRLMGQLTFDESPIEK